MGSYINYSDGDIIGECIFKYEVPPYNKMRTAVFQCTKCGDNNLFTAKIVDVKRKKTKSCGCYHSIKMNSINSTHGLSKHPLYTRWLNMKARCYNKRNDMYVHYGGRGIGMFDEWKNNFKTFYDYLMALPNAMEKGYSIDRINNNSGYIPGNIRWATNKEQQRNKRYNLPPSGHKGIYHVKHTNKWEARVYVNGEYITIGAAFITPEEALGAQRDYFTSPIAR